MPVKPYSYMTQDAEGHWYLLSLSNMTDFETLVAMQIDDPDSEEVARQMEGYRQYRVRAVDMDSLSG